MNKCVEKNIYRICSTILLILVNNLAAPYEVYLFNEPSEANIEEMKCKMRTAHLKRNLFHKLKYTNEWTYSIYYDRLIIACASISEAQIKMIRGETIIRINDRECQIRIINRELVPEEVLFTKTYTNFIPKTDMSKLFDKLPNSTLMTNIRHLGIHHDFKFTDMRQATKSLDEIENIINNEQERQNNYIRSNHHSIMLHITMNNIIDNTNNNYLYNNKV